MIDKVDTFPHNLCTEAHALFPFPGPTTPSFHSHQSGVPLLSRSTLRSPFRSVIPSATHPWSLDWRVVHQFPRLDRTPFVPLDPDTQSEQDSRDCDHRDTHLFPLVHLGFGGKVEELDDIFGHLGGCRWRAVIVFDETIVEDTSHRYS